MKKIGLLLIMFVMMAAAVACGGQQQSTSSPASTPENPPKTEAQDKPQEKPQEQKSEFPKEPIKFIVPYAAGGGTDATARALASAVSKDLGEIGVVNVAGGNAIPGMSQVAQAKPDGHTILMIASEISLLPHMGLSPITYQDFKPIAQINFDPSALTVPADAPYNTIEEFVAYAKENPGKIRVGGTGKGGVWHLGAVSIEKAAGIQFNYVPFDGAAPAITSLLGGHIEAVTVSPAEVLPHVKSGKFKTLAVSSEQRSAVMPDVPTLKEAGIDAVPVGVWRAIVGPKDTPDDVAKVLEEAFMKGADDPEFKSFMEKNGLGLAIHNSQELATLMKEDHEASGVLLKELGIAK